MPKAPEALDPSIWHPELLAAPLRSKRLTVLYGPPGPLRDGMIRRGLMPLLRQPAPQARGRPRRTQVPIRFDGWGPLPLQALRTRIDAEFSAAWPHGAPETLAAHLRAIGRQHHCTVLLVLDAFERHLGERAERHDIERFDIELSECITNDGVPLHVLMVVDELENRALQRYTRWIADFGNDFLRLPSLLSSQAADTAAWRDTDIEAPPEDADDESTADSEAEWAVDLMLDLPAGHTHGDTHHDTHEDTHDDIGADVHGDIRTDPHDDATVAPRAAPRREPDAANAPRGNAPRGRIEPVFIADPPPYSPPAQPPPAQPSPASAPSAHPPSHAPIPTRAAPPAPPPASAKAPPPFVPPPAPAAPPSFGAWPPLEPHAGAAAPGAPPRPPWLSPAEAEQMRRMHEPPSRWPGLIGLALYMAVLFAGAWWVARWIIDSQRVETRPRQDSAPTTQAPAPPVAAPNTAPAPQATAPAPATAPGATPRALSVALPPDSGSAAALVDELIRRVAAPAGLELVMASANQPAMLTLMRPDALLAARAANGPPLQVVAPLYSEQIQVMVRTGARWDYVREIKGLRLNIGRADGARARTARALYQQLFGTALPAAQTNELDLEAALSALQQRGGPIDAVVVVSEAPIEEHLQPALRRQVRELTIDTRQMATVASLPAFSISRRTQQDRARISTTTYLVAPGAPPRPHDAALRRLAAALCRAQPALQSQGSPLLAGLRQGQQPDVGWGYVLPRTPNAVCPQP
jgi:hypothetical protein